MGDLWYAKSDVVDIAKELLGEFHPEVATANFAFVFKDKASTAEIESGIVATAKKVSPLYKLLSKDDLDFVVIIAAPLWDELSATEQKAHLDSALCSCSVKIDEDGEFKLDTSGEVIFTIRQYDLQGHSEILSRYGVDVFAEVGSRIKSALAISQDEALDEEDKGS